MALVVDSDPLSATCNSYVSVQVMDDYVADRVPDPAVKVAWDALTDPQQAMYLVNATRSIDSYASWIGRKYTREQSLDWPRYDAWVDGYMLEVSIVPPAVIEATCEMVVWMMQNAGVVAVQQNAAFDSIKVGPIALDFNEGAGGSKEKYFPDIVAVILGDLGTMSNPTLPSSTSVRVVRISRA